MRRIFASLSLVLLAASVVAACSSLSGSADGSPDAKRAPGPNDPTKKDPANDPANDPATQIVVAIDAESFQSIGMTIGQLEIITRIDGVATTELVDPAQGPLFPRELRLYAPKDRTDAAVEIEIIAHDRVDSMNPPELRRVARTRFVKGTTKLAYVFLEIRCNQAPVAGGFAPYGPTCDAPTTCISGACVSADLPALGDYYADWATNPPSACGSGAPELTIGQGEKAMAPLADGATITLEEGIQCGHHFWLSLSMKNLAQQGTVTTLTATQPGSGIAASGTAYPYRWNAESDGTCALVGLRFQLDAGGQKIADFLGKALDVKVEAKDKAGHTATAVRHIMIDPVMTVIPGRNCAGQANGG